MKQKNKLNKVTIDVSIHWRYLHEDLGKTWREISNDKKRGYDKFSKSTICLHMKKKIGDNVLDKRNNNSGRPPKLSLRDKRNIIRQTEVLKNQIGYFTVRRVKMCAGL